MKILLVEDDLYSAATLLQLLAESHYTIDTVADAKMAWRYVETYNYDLIILDVMLPDSDGIGLCTKLRNSGYSIPVLLLTAKDSMNDRVMGLEAGADDYVVKPYNFQELVARIRALLRRYYENNNLIQELIWEDLRLDLKMHTVTYKEKILRLTQKEHGLLEIFLRHPQQIFSRSALIDQVWSAGEFPSDEAVTTHIKGLRQKLKAAGLPIDPIETLYGLGYRLKPAPVSVSAPVQLKAVSSLPKESVVENLSPLDNGRVQEVIAIMSKKLIAGLPETIAMFRRVAIALEKNKLGANLRYEGYMQAHRLIGSLGSLGFPEESAIARQIEEMLNSEFPLVSSNAELLGQLITKLEQITLKSSPTVLPELPSHHSHSPLPLLLIVDDNVLLTQKILLEAETLGMRVQTALDLTTAREKIEREVPDVILLDIALPNSSQEGLMFLDELAQRETQIPTVMMTAASGLNDRIMVARKGICSFIEKPASTEEILNTVSQVLYQHGSDRSKVMIVDDDPTLLKTLRRSLESREIEVITLQNPKQFWQVLESTTPDLLILDLIMPDYSGVDLCQAVRTSSLWHDLPIVFLSAHSDRETIRQLFVAGADDYLSKPVAESDLYTRIVSRLDRSRLSRQTADFDGLTGVYTHRRGIQVLTQLLRMAARNQQTLSLAILDLDLFKQVNDRYGHIMGDAVLKQFGNLLRQNFRNEDVTMRWGGEEFVVGLYGANLQQSIERLNILLATWRKERFTTVRGESFGITFSAGVVEYPHKGTTLEVLYRNMDAALYQAKAAGRDQIVAASDWLQSA
ncbi:response regulator [Pseudanabaena mucicola]|uniref:Response regulator n=1 Tax=Pseudanabaena mucicola FACHB-723 TaxID=2692860 RepID=A0ABR7ZYW2_9CYAN|nr:response regulator [Pseudanabaena mucicola]MBD2189171.1 response regulator [Pseudanabaena mucicola FACHB-723]